MFARAKGRMGRATRSPLGKELIGQGAGALARFGISTFTTDLGAKILPAALGGVITLINEKTRKSEFIRKAAVNMITAVADPTARSMRSMKRNWDDMIAGLKMGSFSTFQGGLIEEPEEIKSAIRSIIPKRGAIKSKLGSLKGKFGSAGFVGRIKVPSKEELVQPSIAKSYAGVSDPFMDY